MNESEGGGGYVIAFFCQSVCLFVCTSVCMAVSAVEAVGYPLDNNRAITFSSVYLRTLLWPTLFVYQEIPIFSGASWDRIHHLGNSIDYDSGGGVQLR